MSYLVKNYNRKKISFKKGKGSYLYAINGRKLLPNVIGTAGRALDTYQELILKQKGDKCGEWGGDTKEIRIYKKEHKGKIFADYKNTIIDCKDPYSEKIEPKIIGFSFIYLI